jgi:hypothetical protein
MRAAILELDPGAGDEIIHGLRDEHLPRPGRRGGPGADVDCQAGELPTRSHSPVWIPARAFEAEESDGQNGPRGFPTPDARLMTVTGWALRTICARLNCPTGPGCDH